MACCPAPQKDILNSTSLGKDQNSQFEVKFLINTYHSCTIIKPKDCKSNYFKSDTSVVTFSNYLTITAINVQSAGSRAQAETFIRQSCSRRLVSIKWHGDHNGPFERH